MGKTIPLSGRPDVFVFNHAPSQINYGGGVHFHQAAFPPQEQGHLEELAHRALGRFMEMLQARNREDNPHGLGSLARTLLAEESDHLPSLADWQEEIAGVFFDQRLEIAHVGPTAFREWIIQDLAPVARIYGKLRVNALSQEQTSSVAHLNYLITLAVVNLLAEITTDYFEKQFLLHQRLALTARLNWGRALAWALRTVELGNPLQRMRAKHSGQNQPDAACLRLLNPHLLIYADAADAIHFEEILLRVNPYKISPATRSLLTEALSQALGRTPSFEFSDLKKILAEPGSREQILGHPASGQALLKILRRQRESRAQLVLENALVRVRKLLRACSLRYPVPERMTSGASDRELTEVLFKSSARRKLIKALRQAGGPWREIAAHLQDETLVVRASRRGWLGGLSKGLLREEIFAAVGRLGNYLTDAEDFRMVRAHYSRPGGPEATWKGLRLWRAFEIVLEEKGKTELERLYLAPVWSRRKVEAENSFTEGNLFMCVPEGPMYLSNDQRRGRVIFMFADLRNSTETTMKLTKDTASYLAPYLTTVNSSARHCRGERIYFAGDGYAAYFQKITDALRAGYMMVAKFQALQEQSAEQLKQKARELYQAALALDVNLRNPGRLAALLPSLEKKGVRPEVLEFLQTVAQHGAQEIRDAELRTILAKTASAYAMPRIDIGIACTMGELFFALVGEEHEDKIPIVISPHLTQAARLSGSSEVVKNYIETKLPQPFHYNVFTWDKKLYNRGIVIPDTLFQQLRQEVKVIPIPTDEASLAYYYDHALGRRVICRRNQEPVLLKGIAEPCVVHEVALPGSYLDQQFGAEP